MSDSTELAEVSSLRLSCDSCGLAGFFNRLDRRKDLLADLLIGFTVFGTEIFFIESDRPANHDCDRIWRDFSSFWPRLKGTKNPHWDNWGQRLGNYHAD